jgi:hypothetical protein
MAMALELATLTVAACSCTFSESTRQETAVVWHLRLLPEIPYIHFRGTERAGEFSGA